MIANDRLTRTIESCQSGHLLKRTKMCNHNSIHHITRNITVHRACITHLLTSQPACLLPEQTQLKRDIWHARNSRSTLCLLQIINCQCQIAPLCLI